MQAMVATLTTETRLSKAKGLKWGPRTELYYSLQVFNGDFMIKIQMVMSGYLNWIQSRMLEAQFGEDGSLFTSMCVDYSQGRACGDEPRSTTVNCTYFPLQSCSYLILDGSSSWFSQAHIMWIAAWAPASDDGR
ncbi:hypothetical protein VNO77_34134 [Canavalia gladiata]|uniref:Uncharacterized protein n=1 Tax=Canavalia gladiata TaxID=3824 RepID=A0AAN9KFN2_CANGL